ncbi:MAG TPA: TetR/AcrR family transcriptional regulator C-terminal domain-containing protein [Luteibacter sp.]|uniref:TetR/AcrR family transcriptional regulator C-terminal domain-containing protein n=1 Tax=Luteibacter sp. TaxID=1886636 RepID=UPI002CF14B13|nr:TetR/AcrR family transcriptional regulator C-terminal domain-containing protein [Luteibacter sp.]HVI53749.1 TetR/AcrR family transcriptional regulator C-terminal domain-containing protein [Luteibacter sp.]
MKVNRDIIVQAALRLLDETGLEDLTLRKLAQTLDIQAPTLYWHFKSKDALIDEMATLVLVDGAANLMPGEPSDDWRVWVSSFGQGLRRTLLGYRDGGRMIAGTRLTNTLFQETAERIGGHLTQAGFTTRQAVTLLSAVYTFTVSFAIEEQAVFPRPGERSPAYDIDMRKTHLDPDAFPLLREAGDVLFDRFDQRFDESIDLMLRGAATLLPG